MHKQKLRAEEKKKQQLQSWTKAGRW